MNFAIPFFGRKAKNPATLHALDAALAQQGERGDPSRPNPRRFRAFVRPAPTTFQRCLAAHIYLAQRISALD
jgi:hypothetical protein